MKYQFSTRNATIFDGQTVPAGQVVATIETNLPIGNITSAIISSNLHVQEVEEPIAPVAREAVGIDAPNSPAPKPKPSASVDPDALNEEDNASDSSSANADTGSSDKPSEPAASQPSAPEIVIDASLAGLSDRIAKSLTSQSLGTRDLIAAYVSEGKDLVDLDGVGKKAAEEIKAWLAK